MGKNYKGRLLRIIVISILLVLIQPCFTLSAHAEEDFDSEAVMEEQAGNGEIGKLEDQLEKHSNEDIRDIVGDYSPQKLIKDTANGRFRLNMAEIVKRAMQYLFKEIYLNIHIMIKLILLTVLCAVLRNLQASFLSESVGELAFYTCYILVVSVLIVSFSSALNLGIGIIDSMVDFMYAAVPVLITLLVSGGNITSGGVFQPILIMMVEVSATLIKNVFIPLILLSTVLSIVDNISDKVQISKMAGFLKQVAGWGLGIILTVFVAVVAVQGSLGAVVDGVASKTVKYAIGAFIPVVGKCLSDAADAVLGCTLLIKNAAGIAAMIGIIVICLVPILKIVALIVLYRLVCMLIEPISEKRLVNTINEVAGSMTYILGVTASVAFMFLLSITAIISASNLSAMVR